MRIRSITRQACGFAMLEVLISLLVVAMGILGIAKIQALAIGSSAEAKARTEAMTLAQAKVEELRNFVLQTQHYQVVASVCQSGTLVQSGSDTRTGVNANFTRTWTITPNCAPARHQVLVNVAWTGAENSAKQVQLHSLIAWNNPARSTLKLAAGTTGGGGLSPTGNAWLGDDVVDYQQLPDGAVSNGSDDTYIYNPEAERWELLVRVADGYLVALYSRVPIVSLSGIVALDTKSSPDTRTDVLINNLAVYRTDVTYCTFPLKFTNQDNPGTYGSDGAGGTGQLSAATDKAGAYRCYVPQGWYGNVGLLQKSYTNTDACRSKYNLLDGGTKVGTCDFKEVYGCPGGADGAATLSGFRSHRVLIVDGSNNIIGQTGLMPAHEKMAMPGYSNLTRLSRLDFLVFKPKTSGNPKVESCADRIPSTGTVDSGTISTAASYALLQRTNAAMTSANSSSTYDGVPSVRYPHYIVDRYTSGGGGFVKVSGALNGSCTSLTASGSGSWPSFTCTVGSAQYSCDVSYNWSGMIGNQSFSNVTANTTQDITCP